MQTRLLTRTMSFVDKHRLALHMQYVHLMLHEPMPIHMPHVPFPSNALFHGLPCPGGKSFAKLLRKGKEKSVSRKRQREDHMHKETNLTLHTPLF